MKKINSFLLAASLLVGSLLVNTANVSAVSNTGASNADITSQQPSVYQNGVEKNIGVVVPGTSVPNQFKNVGFFVSGGEQFTSTSYRLASGRQSPFSLTDVAINGPTDSLNFHLSLTVNFLPTDVTVYQDYVDTLIISADSAADFTIPLRGTSVPLAVNPLGLQDFGNVLVNQTSDPKVITVTSLADADQIVFGFNDTNSPFEAEVESSSGTTVLINVTYTPTHAGTDTDTLWIKHDAYDLTYRIPVVGNGAFVVATPAALYFNTIPVNDTTALTVSVSVLAGSGAQIAPPTISPSANFSYTLVNWTPTGGGDILVNFTPSAVAAYNATLTLTGTGFADINIPLNGGGGLQPVISSDTTSYAFAPIPALSTALSDSITITLTHHLSQLTDPGVFTIASQNNIFQVASVYRDATLPLEPNVVKIIISFTPPEGYYYTDTLVVQADYANAYYIPLSGEGYKSTLRGTTAIATQTVEATSVSVQNGNIVVSQAPIGSKVIVYNLQGQAVKSQTVGSTVEIVKTAALPKSVYIVVVNDKQEILKQKVIL